MYRPADSIPVEAPPLPQATIYLVFGFPGFDAVTAGWLSNAPVDSSLLWDRQGWLSKARDSESVSRLPPHNKIYLANLREAKEEYSSDAASSLLAVMPPPGFGAAVIKMASAGVTIVQTAASEAQCEHILGFPVETPASIGSGDVLAGVTAARLANGDPLGDAIAAGNAAAATYLAASCDPFAPNLVLGATELLNTRR
jgi:sugar/nucleoside kinase (ribokinase family)